MKLKMTIEVEISTEENVTTEQAKTILLSFFRDIRNDTVGGECLSSVVKDVTLIEMYKNGLPI